MIERTKDHTIPQPLCVNWTLTTKCNYNCRFCFARFPELKETSPLPLREMLRILNLIVDAGCEKLTFVGGEPMLYPHLLTLISEAHNSGLTTMLVTNGSLLTTDFLVKSHDFLDWIVLSVDSQSEAVESLLGRGQGNHVSQTIKNSQLVRDFSIGLKINTVVTKLNIHENMVRFINLLRPERWKVFQFLPVKGQNDCAVNDLAISQQEFIEFSKHHAHLPYAVFEDNAAMTGSYIMISSQGSFFSNTSGFHVYSDPILKVGVATGLRQVGWDCQKFIDRGGIYEWARSD